MPVTLKEFNEMSAKALEKKLEQCCSAKKWSKELISKRPYTSFENLVSESNQIWSNLGKNDWLKAFAGHPRIGDLSTLAKKYAATAQVAASEQAATAVANKMVLNDLAKKNRLYFEKFGYIFIICATGKSADEMLFSLNERLLNDSKQEILIAANEQNKITNIRLKKLIE